MKSSWNLLIGLLCLTATILDYTILDISWNTPLLSFFAGVNLLYWFTDRFALHAKVEGAE